MTWGVVGRVTVRASVFKLYCTYCTIQYIHAVHHSYCRFEYYYGGKPVTPDSGPKLLSLSEFRCSGRTQVTSEYLNAGR
jgi:hypothetical protein